MGPGDTPKLDVPGIAYGDFREHLLRADSATIGPALQGHTVDGFIRLRGL